MSCYSIRVSYECVDGVSLGVFENCGRLQLPFNADEDGDWTLEFKHAQSLVKHTFPVTNGSPVVVSLDWFNENKEVCFEIRNSSNAIVGFNITEDQSTPCVSGDQNALGCFSKFYITVTPTISLNTEIDASKTLYTCEGFVNP